MAVTEAELKLEPLPAEWWGSRLRDARRSRGLTLGDVERLTRGEILASSLSDLEQRQTRPSRKSQRRRAAMAMILYRYAPSEIGLSLEDVGFTDVRRVRDLLDHEAERLPSTSSPYITTRSGRRVA